MTIDPRGVVLGNWRRGEEEWARGRRGKRGIGKKKKRDVNWRRKNYYFHSCSLQLTLPTIYSYYRGTSTQIEKYNASEWTLINYLGLADRHSNTGRTLDHNGWPVQGQPMIQSPVRSVMLLTTRPVINHFYSSISFLNLISFPVDFILALSSSLTLCHYNFLPHMKRSRIKVGKLCLEWPIILLGCQFFREIVPLH